MTKIMRKGVMGVIEWEGKYLFGLESKNSPFKGKWRLLGGKLDGTETSEQAMIRECYEEAGIKVNVNGFLGSTPGTIGNILIDICHCKYLSGNVYPKLDEISDAKWLTRDEVYNMNVDALSLSMFELYLAKVG